MPTPETNAPSSAATLVEVLDQARRVVALLPAAEAARQKLCHRTVAILLFDEQGRLSLRKRDVGLATRPARWDVTVRSAVLAGESLQDAAARALMTETGLHSERMRPLLEMPALPENNNEFLQVFALTKPETLVEAADSESGEYSFAPEELDCLLRDFRELVSPRFLQLAEAMSLKGLWRRRP